MSFFFKRELILADSLYSDRVYSDNKYKLYYYEIKNYQVIYSKKEKDAFHSIFNNFLKYLKINDYIMVDYDVKYGKKRYLYINIPKIILRNIKLNSIIN